MQAKMWLAGLMCSMAGHKGRRPTAPPPRPHASRPTLPTAPARPFVRDRHLLTAFYRRPRKSPAVPGSLGRENSRGLARSGACSGSGRGSGSEDAGWRRWRAASGPPFSAGRAGAAVGVWSFGGGGLSCGASALQPGASAGGCAGRNPAASAASPAAPPLARSFSLFHALKCG